MNICRWTQKYWTRFLVGNPNASAEIKIIGRIGPVTIHERIGGTPRVGIGRGGGKVHHVGKYKQVRQVDRCPSLKIRAVDSEFEVIPVYYIRYSRCQGAVICIPGVIGPYTRRPCPRHCLPEKIIRPERQHGQLSGFQWRISGTRCVVRIGIG